MSRAADASASQLYEEHVSARGRRREPEVDNDKFYRNPIQAFEGAKLTENGLKEGAGPTPTTF